MDILFSIIGLGLLVLGAEIIIRGSVSFGRKINISLFAIGVVIVAGEHHYLNWQAALMQFLMIFRILL